MSKLIKKAPAAPKPRNPFVQHLLKRPQGPHTKSPKGIRAREKAELRRSV